jgi:chemotaxis family two-component system sensor kinase Cph1
VFQNLIGNALKFRGYQPPRISITGSQTETDVVLKVRDNGIGIPPEFRDRIFLIFQRLHTRKAYPGTGMGLAICKHIIDRHGGWITVEAADGGGSLFSIGLPTSNALGKTPLSSPPVATRSTTVTPEAKHG